MSITPVRRPHRPREHRAPREHVVLPLDVTRLLALLTAAGSLAAAVVAIVSASTDGPVSSLSDRITLLVAVVLLIAPLCLGASLVLVARQSGVLRPAGTRPRLVPAALLAVALSSAVLYVEGWTVAPSLALAGVSALGFGVVLALPVDRRRATALLAVLNVLTGIAVICAGITLGDPFIIAGGSAFVLPALLLARTAS